MKSQKVIALLLSTALSVSTCMPLGNITALGAETEPAAQAVEVQEEDSDSAENEESPQEEDSSEAEATENISEDDSEEPAEEAASETVDDEESSDESNAAVPAQEAESSETEENDSDQEASPEENQTDNTAPAGTETIRKGTGNSGSDAGSGSDSGSDPEIVTGSDPNTWSDSDDFSNFIEIEAGEDKTADFSGGNSFVLFRFTPDETCEYKFYSDSDVDTYAELYDSSLSLIYASDNDDGSNFKIYDTFNEGDTYYFKVGSWDSDLTSFKVHLRKIYFSCEPVGEAERNVSPNETVTLEVKAESSSEISCQWYDPDNNPIEGADSPAYTFKAQKNGYYTCHLYDEDGNSDDVGYQVIIENNLDAYTEDEYGNHVYWAEYPVAPNETVELNVSVSADDMDGLTYEWTDNDGNPVEDAGTTSCTVGPVSQNNYYYFNVSDQYGNSASVTFDVRVQNHLNAYSKDEDGNTTKWPTVYTAPNGTVELTAAVTADDMDGLTYKWTDSDGDPVEGADTTSCTVGPVSQNNYYYFNVSDQYGNSASVTFDVRVENHLQAYTTYYDEYDESEQTTTSKTIYVAPNESVDLNVTVTADDMDSLTYEWTDDNGNPIEGAGTTSCTVGPVAKNETYHFTVSDQYSNSVSVYFSIRVQNHLEAYTTYTEDGKTEQTDYLSLGVAPNASADLKVTVSADDMEGLTYEWTDSDGDPIEGGDINSCTVGPVTERGSYYFNVFDPYGNSSSVSFEVYVENHLTVYPEGAEEGDNRKTLHAAPGQPLDLNAIVSADETENLTYSWYVEDDPVGGNNQSSYTIDSVTCSQVYRLKVDDLYGNSGEAYFEVIAENHLDAYTKDKYGNETWSPTVYAAPNETLDLNVTVSADDMDGLTYEWTDNDGNPVESADTTSCTVGPVTKNEKYSFHVSDQYGNSASVYFDVCVENHLQAYTTYYDEDSEEEQTATDRTIYVAPNESVDLNVTVTADDMDSLTYEWTDNDGNTVEGAGTTSCTVGPVTKNGNYTFTVYDQYGNSASVYFYIRVQNHLEAYTTYTEDGETQQTNYLTLGVAPNASADLNVTVSADDMEGLTYEWTDSNDNPIEGGDINSCTVGPVTERGSYYFNVFDPYGNSSSVSFEVYVENHLTVYPEGAEEGYNRKTLYAAPGQPLDLNAIVSADETENLTYSWYIEDDPVDGNNQSSYTIDSVTYSHTYKLKVEDPYGNSREAYFEVIVENNLHAYAAGTDEDGYKYVAVTPGESADLKVIASADDMSEVTYTWYYLDDWELTNPIAGAVSDTYHIDSVTQQQDYRCYVEDKYGNKDDVIFYVYAENHLRVYPEGESEDSTEKEITVPYGSSVEFNAIVDADDKTQLTYEWRNDDGEIIEGNNTASFNIDTVKYRQRYEFRVSDQYGNWEHIYFVANVQNHLNVYPQGEDKDSDSVDIYVPYGESADLKAALEADDQTQLEYRWFDGNGNRVSPASPLNCQTDPIHDDEQYYISVEDQYGNYDIVYFNIYVQNHLTAYPEGESADSDTTDIRIQTGKTADLKAIVSADDKDGLIYEWSKQEYDSELDDYYYDTISGDNTDSYTTEPLTKDQTYRLRISDKYNNSKDVFFNVIIVGDLEKQIISADETMSLPYGSSGTISVNGAQGTLSFTSSNPSIASVDNTGKVTANKAGTAKITIFAEATDTYNQSNQITVTVTVTGISIEDAEVSGLEDKTYDGNAQTQTPVVKLGSTTLTEGTDYTISYSNNINAGKATLTITGKGNYTGTAPAAEFTINPASIKDADVSGLEDKTYNSEEQKQTPVVKVGSTTLVEGTDYTVSYKNNTDAGKATVTITGKGNYTGTKDSNFTINPASIKDADVSGLEDKTYNGEEQKQTPVVKVGSTTLVEGTDYTVSYKNNTDAGKATVTITGKGNYTDTKGSNFTINPASIKDADVSGLEDKTYNGEEQKQTPVVKVASATLTEGTDYTVSYKNNTDAGTATVTITGKGNYTGTKDSDFTINPASIEDAEVSGLEDKTYNGEEQKQAPVVKVGSATLENEKDYTVSYSNNTNAGKATVTITGTGNYTGELPVAEFTINPASIKDAEVTEIVDKIYNGQEQTQTPVVKVGSATLKEGTDYTLTYDNNIELSTDDNKASLTITGIGNYTGTVKKDFTITDKISIETAEVEAITGLVYNGKEQKPTPVVKINSTPLKEGTDYTIDSYSNNTNAGTATMTITGKGGYFNSKTIEFTINPAPISSASISGIANKTYNGKAQAQTPVVTFGSATLKEKTDYTVSYKNNTNAGTATVTFTAVAKSNFTGTVNKTFTISKAAQSFTVRAAAAAINVGNTTRVTASGAKENPKYTFTSSNTRIATVNTAGTVTGKAAGTVTITVNAAATANYNALSKTVNITVNKVLKRPGYCHFIKWNNSKYTSCRIGWRKVDGADGYQTYLCWTNGSHASTTIVKSNVLYRNCTVHPQHVSQMKVRAFYMQNGQRKFGPWSNIEYITPSPTKLTTRNVGTKNSPKIKASWNIIYGCNGYNVFITTNPNGKWYWNQSTSQKATSTSAVIDKCGGAKLKKNTRYYVRLVTRRKRHGVFCTVPMPAKNTYVGSFIIK